MAAIKVLLADDEGSVLQIMAQKTAGAGYGVVTACDGQEAWAKIKSENPDVIILDLIMPKMDGWEVLRRLRAQPPSPKWQPVIIVSALDELSDVQKGLTLQADHYLTKPCRMEDVIKAIRLMVSLIPRHI
ncbi:MAG: response regulator [Candidatus Omnitrophica bacterium]|nr:response regulator [Candidatus Omnitrophota bacterium]